jgi:hypothetical protein
MTYQSIIVLNLKLVSLVLPMGLYMYVVIRRNLHLSHFLWLFLTPLRIDPRVQSKSRNLG